MNPLRIAQNPEGVFIHIDTTSTPREKVEDAIRLLQLHFFDDSHIPSVEKDEQSEIEAALDRLTDDDREIAFTRTAKIWSLSVSRIQNKRTNSSKKIPNGSPVKNARRSSYPA